MFNFPNNSRKYRAENCGKILSFEVLGKSIVDCSA